VRSGAIERNCGKSRSSMACTGRDHPFLSSRCSRRLSTGSS
jgi:hypothetical protein